MKLLFYMMILASMFAVSACSVYALKSPESTSSGRAAYGNAVHEFRAHKKKNQKKKKNARKAAKRKKSRGNQSYWYRRPY